MGRRWELVGQGQEDCAGSGGRWCKLLESDGPDRRGKSETREMAVREDGGCGGWVGHGWMSLLRMMLGGVTCVPFCWITIARFNG